MADGGRASLRRFLVSGYDDLKERLTRRFGSSDVATEALNETWLRLEKVTEIAAVRDPEHYLYRMAVNTAIDRRRADARWVSHATIEEVLQFEDEAPGPERITIARSQIAALDRMLAELPQRTREIFLAVLIEELPYREIAERFGLSLRSVEREMARAFGHCSEQLKEMLARTPATSRNDAQTERSRRKTEDTADDK